MMDDSVIGTEVDGYRIQEVLGRGGMGVVYKAEDVALSRDVALKRIDPSLANDEAFLRRFRSEARALARIDSPYIVGVHALRQTEIGLLIVMEYVDGGTLKDLINQGPMGWPEALPYITQMLTALEHAHGAEVIHRDIKPRNILLSADGTVKITDFGLAKVYRGDADETVTQGVHGTLNYMSPEQVQGESDLDPRSDLYSLGMTIYEMLAGDLPFDDDSSEFTKMRMIVEKELPRPDELRPQVPDGLSALVMKALEKDPDDRFQSAEVMRESFEALGEKHRNGAPSGTSLATAKSSATSFRWRRLLLAGLAVLLAGAGGVYWWFGSGEVPVTKLSVSSEPSGATVLLKGTPIGKTPLTDTIEGRSAPIRVQRAGYAPVLDTVTQLAERPSVEVGVQLPLQSVPVTVQTSPEDAEVYLGNEGEMIGRTPLTNYEVRNRQFQQFMEQDSLLRIRVRKEGHRPRDTIVVASQTDQLRLNWQLEPEQTRTEPSASPADEDTEDTRKYGTLTLRAAPQGDVLVDGTSYTQGQSIRVPVGEHRIQFRYSDFAKDTTLVVRAEESQALTCHFAHQVFVQSDPVWASVYIGGENTGKDTEYRTRLEPGTYQIGVRVQRGDWKVDGGVHRLSTGETRRTQKFSGPVRTLTLEPSFKEETHVIDFQLSNGGA
jgi:predicted Ser/Thr protein kinase